MVKHNSTNKKLFANKYLTLAFLISFVLLGYIFLAFGQSNMPVWRGTNKIKAPTLSENLEYLYEQINQLNQKVQNLQNQVNSSVRTGLIVAGCTGKKTVTHWGGANIHTCLSKRLNKTLTIT